MRNIFDFRNYQIKRDDDYIFGTNGRFIRKVEREGPHSIPQKK